MKINSYWDFEREMEGFIEETSSEIPTMPAHDSHKFIDIDFVRNLMFNESGNQKGIEIYSEDINKDNLISPLGITLEYNSEDIVRICFDFENNLIMTKSKSGTEDTFYFMDLQEYQDIIYDGLNLETFCLDDVRDEIEAMLLLNGFNDMTLEEKQEFIKNYVISTFINSIDKGVDDDFSELDLNGDEN